ncbi:anthranilate synthase / indole-3-glycerol phosphate synthase [Emydomyces testavorans]|uniref:Anthranilate synthase / indole-3-glycerol phosphate synthase n=1 Tax=Emydomyces testavorans TaxID=2070801 RepID=A0AAF0DCJ3_9EURO|nr:anthranilate synthase / indole-3-glycerol phosphate synthase [Emydomyces testavorans]
MGKTFGKVNVCTAGDFGTQADKIKQWVEANGGIYSKQLTLDVTHLITTEAAFRKAVPEGKGPLSIPLPANYGYRKLRRTQCVQLNLKIVSIDWLEDSLLSKTKRPKREGPYLWSRKIKSEKKEALDEKKKTASKSGATRKQVHEIGIDGYHVYTDGAGVRYSAMLIRPTFLPRFRERHMLRMYESDSLPRMYTVFVKYSRVGKNAAQVLAPPGSTLDAALSIFNKFFKAKSGLNWNQRDKKAPPKTAKGVELPPDEGWFEYAPEKPPPAPRSLPSVPSVLPVPQHDEEAATAATIAMLEDAIRQMESSEPEESGTDGTSIQSPSTSC